MSYRSKDYGEWAVVRSHRFACMWLVVHRHDRYKPVIRFRTRLGAVLCARRLGRWGSEAL